MLLKDTFHKTQHALKDMSYPIWVWLVVFIIILLLPMPFDVLIAAAIMVKMRNLMRKAIGIERGNRKNQE